MRLHLENPARNRMRVPNRALFACQQADARGQPIAL